MLPGSEDEIDWSKQLDRLAQNPSLWDGIISGLQEEMDPALHPLARSAKTVNGDSLLHLAVLQDRRDCISLFFSGENESSQVRFLLARRNHFGLTSLELAQFLDRQESRRALSGRLSCDFLSQPNVDFEEPERFANLQMRYCSHPLFETWEFLNSILSHTARAQAKDAIPFEKLWMGIYYDLEIQQSLHPFVTVRFINETIGCGVFAKERILPGVVVGEHTGLVQQRRRNLPSMGKYAFRYTTWPMGKRQYIIDAERVGNFTRFINHSKCPNIRLRSAYWRGIPRLLYISLSEIQANTELTCDFDTFWKPWPRLASS